VLTTTSHNLHSSITEKLQKYTDVKEELIRIWQLTPVRIIPPVLSTAGKKVKGKAVPLQAQSGPEGSRKLRFPDFMPTAQDGGKVSLKHRPPLLPGNTPGAHFC